MSKKIERKNMTLTDDKGKVIRGPEKDNATQMAQYLWWKEKENDSLLAQNITATIRQIATHQSARNEQLTISTRLYGNTSAYSLLGTAFTRASSVNSNPTSQRISFNLCQSVIDTIVSKVAKNKVIPMFITSGGDWEMQRKAEKLNKFLEGCFYENKVHKKSLNGVMDGSIWGDGLVYVFNDNGRAAVERALPHEFFVDLVETLSGPPRQMHRVKVADRGVLAELYPEYAAEIMSASPAGLEQIGGMGTVADLLAVSDSYHLRSSKDSDDGLHVICLLGTDVVIHKEDWKKDYYPFPTFTYKKRPLGHWGIGACERLQNLQGEVNRLMVLIQRSMWMGGSFKILSHITDKIPTQHFNNEVGPILKWAGSIPPQYIAPPIIQQDIYPYVDTLIAKGYQQEGVSQLAASSLKPQGVDSGAAMRTYDQIGDDRLLSLGQDVEDFVLEIGRQLIEVAKDIYKEKKSYETVFPSVGFMETIDWKDIDLEADEYVLRAYPTSTLPDDPAGRLQTIQEQMQAGLISPRAGKRLMSMPDVEMADMLSNAKEDLLHKIFEQMLDDGDYQAPEPFFDLVLAKSLVLDYYNYAMFHNAPKDRLALLQRFSEQLDDLAVQESAPQPGTQLGVPMANPTPAPTSQLVPNVNQGSIQ